MAPTHTRSNSFYLSTLSTPPSPRKMTETTNFHHKECFVYIIEVLQKSWDFSWQSFSTHIDWPTATKGQYGREQIPSTPGSFDSVKMPTGSCLAAVVGFLDPQSGGYIGNTYIYMLIYVHIKKYMYKNIFMYLYSYLHIKPWLWLLYLLVLLILFYYICASYPSPWVFFFLLHI